MSNVADSAEATSNGRVGSFLGAATTLPPADVLLDDELETATVEARGYWEGVWLRLRRDKLALAGEIPGFKVGGSWRFERQAIASWIKRKVEEQQKGTTGMKAGAGDV